MAKPRDTNQDRPGLTTLTGAELDQVNGGIPHPVSTDTDPAPELILFPRRFEVPFKTILVPGGPVFVD